jgi:hypothetical protein
MNGEHWPLIRESYDRQRFRYLTELKRIGTQVSAFPSSMRKQMARSPMLVGTRRVAKVSTRNPKERRGSDASDDEGEVEIHFELLRAEDVSA